MLIPASSLSLSLDQTDYKSGDSIQPVISNTGGADTQVQYKLTLFDTESSLIAEKINVEPIPASSSRSVSLAIPDDIAEGAYNFAVDYFDQSTGKENISYYEIAITGMKGALQVRTDKEMYLANENIWGLSTITNSGTTPIQNGNFHLQVSTAAGDEMEKTWTSQLDFQQGRRVGVDNYGVNDWIIPDDDFEAPELDLTKWIANGTVTINGGKLLLKSPSGTQSEIISKWSFDGNFEIQVDFTDNSSSIEDEGSELGVHIGNYKVLMKNTRRSGYFSGIHRISDGVFITHKSSGSATYSTSGGFKIAKVGTTLITYNKQGANWVEHFRYTLADLKNQSVVTILLWAGLGYPVTAEYDNFKVNSGRIVSSNETVNSLRLLPLNDNFDDGITNSDRWVVRNLFGTSGFGVEGNSKLSLSINDGKYGEVMEAVGKTRLLQGDFGVETSWKDFTSTARGAGTVAELALALNDDNYVYIKRARGDSGDYIWRDIRVDGKWISFASVNTTQSSGKFKISRSNSVVRTFYEDAGSWVELGAAVTFKPDDVTPILKLWMGADGSASASFDNFKITPSKYTASGKVNLQHDAGQTVKWGKLSFGASTPTDTSVKFRTRTAATAEALAESPWSDYLLTSGVPITSPNGRWIEIETSLEATNPNITPLLHDVTVTYGNNAGDVVWQTDVPVNQQQGIVTNPTNFIGRLGKVGKLILQGTLTSSTGRILSSAENPFYVEQGNIQLLLSPDKKIYKPGETVTISGEVKNPSTIAAAGLALQVKNSGVGGRVLYNETMDISADGVHPFSITTTAGTDDTYGLNGVVTQNGTIVAEIADSYETASPVVTANLSMPDTVGTDPFTITLSLTNSGKVNATTAVRIINDSGEIIDDQALVIPAGESRMQKYTRRVTATTTYTATFTGDLTQTITKAVAYIPAPLAVIVTSKVVADKISYNTNEQVAITSTITSQNTVAENLTAWITINNIQGQALYSVTADIPTLVQGQATAINTYWNTGTKPSGNYLVTLQILDAARTVISKSTCELVISTTTKPTALLKGQISLDKQHILTGEPVTVFYNVTNAGNMDLSNIALSIQTVNLSEQTVYNTIAGQATLAMGAIYTNTGQIDTQNYGARDYLVILRASIGGVEETLAGTYFRVEGAPSAPALSGPANGNDVETLTPVLGVSNAADPNDDRLTYEFEIFADSGLTNLVTSDMVSETAGITAWTVPAPLTENQTYYWRARAYDGKLYGPWLAPAAFRVNTFDDPPSAPTISSPVDGTAVAVFTPALAINNSTDPDSASLTYNFQLALDPDFSQIVASVKGVASGEGTTSWTVPVNLQENGLYYWRAQADDWLVEGPWSTTTRFFVNTANDPPSVPVVTVPASGSSVSALETDIVASNAKDPDSSPLSYFFEADTVPTFDSANILRSGAMAEGEGNTGWHVNGLLDNTRYFVRAKASDGTAESAWSPVTEFFANTANDPPTTPILANPSDGAGVNVFAPTLSVHNATDPDKDLLTYEFEVYADAAMTNLVTQTDSVAETAQVTAWEVPVPLMENLTFYWRARAYDGALHSDWMPLAAFMVNTANDAPGAPVLSAPAEGSSVTTLSPTLAVMNAVDPDSDNLTYEFAIYSGTSLVAAISDVPEEVSGVTAWTPSTVLNDNTAYQWRVRAYDGDNYGPWTAMAPFTVHIPKASINASIDFDPDTLNKSSNGTWVVVYIELPGGYRPADIDISSIRLEASIQAEPWPYAIGDHDKDGIPDFMVKFRRSDVINLLRDGERVPAHVTGKVGSTPFEGVDVIRVVR